jgi:outer membrane protein assembly factor BamA
MGAGNRWKVAACSCHREQREAGRPLVIGHSLSVAGYRLALGSLMLMVLGTSCRGLKHATEEQPLFSAYHVKWTEPPEFEPTEALQELEGVVAPSPNNSIFGMRPTVALHNMVKEPKKPRGLRNLLKYRMGSPPVYLKDVPLDDINNALVNRMNNRGHFAASSSYTVKHKGRTAVVTWTVRPGRPHLLRHIRYGDSTATQLDSAIAVVRRGLQLEPGMPYHLNWLTAERATVTDRVRDQGWYRLRADDLIWATDTTVGDHQVDIHLRVKPTTSTAKRIPYDIGTVTVRGDHDDVLPARDSVMVDSLLYVNTLNMYRPHTITRGVFISPGQRYSMRRQNATQRYLTSYGVFRNVLVTYHEDSARRDLLHAEVRLVPQNRFSLFSELNAVSKSNNFAGPGLKVGFRDRDLFRGAEQFTLDLNGRFETQIAGEGTGTNAYEIGTKAGLQVPRMLLFPFLRTTRTSVPLTHFALGYGLFRRIGLFGLESANAGMSYTWREDRRTWHDLQLLEVSYNNLYFASDEFNAFLDQNPAIQRSFEEQFIIGFGYNYTRSTKRRDQQRNWFVYTVGGDEGGNLTSAIYSAAEGARPEDGFTLFGERFSQYVRFRPELRWYQQLGTKGSLLATRLLAHGAFAYGNSSTVPYVKQFFSGGTNSLRGFRARSVGPGSYVSDASNNLLIDQVGDLKLEMNLEYRTVLAGMFKGALFVDAGNVWLLNDDPQRPGGKFNWNEVIDELAVNAGFGLRIDPEVIVIRLDLAFPLRRPDLPQGDRWVFDDLDSRWNRNFILNIAIGYPF